MPDGKLSVVKVVLSSGKTAYFREMKISHTEMAAQQVSQKAGDSSNMLQLLMQKALVQILLVAIGSDRDAQPQKLTPIQIEDMDSLFTVAEYTQVLKAIGKMTGGDDLGKEVRMEMVAEL